MPYGDANTFLRTSFGFLMLVRHEMMPNIMTGLLDLETFFRFNKISSLTPTFTFQSTIVKIVKKPRDHQIYVLFEVDIVDNGMTVLTCKESCPAGIDFTKSSIRRVSRNLVRKDSASCSVKRDSDAEPVLRTPS